MDAPSLLDLLHQLISEWESEIVEFKQASSDYETGKIGEYFSALANEANLRGGERAWLVSGVHDKTRAVVGSDYRPEPARLQRAITTHARASAKRLRQGGLIEGRRPNYHVSAVVAQATSAQADYIRMRAQDDIFYAKLLTDYLEKFGEASRADINRLLLGKLGEMLTEKQKINKINNLLTKLRRHGVIFNAGVDSAPRRRLAEKFAEKK
jgi:hypothetical protein